MAVSFKSIFGDWDSDTVTGLENKFRNTALWSYLPLVISFFFRETHAWENWLLDEARYNVHAYIDDMLQLSKFLKALKEGKASGRGWHFDSRSDVGSSLYDSVESLFLKKLDALPSIIHPYEWDGSFQDLSAEWEESLSVFPSSDSFQKEEKVIGDGGDEAFHLSLSEISRAIESIKNCKKVARSFTLESDEQMVKRFVAYMIDNKVPESRAMYRCWYDALDCFWGIPVVIKNSHKNLPPESYAESSYIKSFAKRYHDNQNKVSVP